MTAAAWLAEVGRRIRAYEGCRLTRYLDSVGVPTIAYGFNLENPRAGTILQLCGVPAGDTGAVIAGELPLTQAQADATFDFMLPGYVRAAEGTLAPGIFGQLDDARRFVIVDLTYNMGAGPDGWGGFTATQSIIAKGVVAKAQGKFDAASALFAAAADHLAASEWAAQVGERATHDCEMMRTSEWSPPC